MNLEPSPACEPVIAGPDWTLVNARAPWQSRDSQGRVIHDGNMWILGGWFSPTDPNPRDVWKSADGSGWTQMVDVAPWEHGDLPAVFSHHGKLWLMGGRKLPGKENSNRIWSSPDGADWKLEGEAAWCPRVCHGYTQFRDRLWIMGGTEDFYDDNEETLKNDVWSSADGIQWDLESAHAGWSRRRDASVVVFQDKIWLMGGGSWYPETVPLNDVWNSADGIHWNLVTATAPWPPRLWSSLVVYRDHMWLFGGWNRTDGNFNDVWVTADGVEWKRVESKVIWTPRHAQSAYVFNDRIILAGGHANPVNSEVWSLWVPGDFLQ